MPFRLAINDILMQTNVPAQAPLKQTMDINMGVVELFDCLKIVKVSRKCAGCLGILGDRRGIGMYMQRLEYTRSTS